MSEILLERETTISYNDEEDTAQVWSASPYVQRKMEKLGIEPYQTANGQHNIRSCWYRVPKKWVRIRKPIQRIFTPEQKEAAAERARMQFKRD